MLRREPSEQIGAAPSANPASDPDHDERTKGEAVAIVHVDDVRCLFSLRQPPETARSDLASCLSTRSWYMSMFFFRC